MQPPEGKLGEGQSDSREVFNYRQALHHMATSRLPLSLRLMKEAHGILLEGVRGGNKMPGEFRKIQVAIGASRRFIPPPPQLLLSCLSPLEKYCHQTAAGFDPLVACFLVHYQFETIHPFVDGNGRVGRVILAHMLQSACELSKPWLYMSEYFEAHKDEYIRKLFNVIARGDWEAWIEFCLAGVLFQAKDTILRCERLRKIREEFIDRLKAAGGSVRLHQIVESIFTSPFVRIADLQKALGVTYPTAKADVERLVAAGILKALPKLNPKTFYAPEVFDIAYEAV